MRTGLERTHRGAFAGDPERLQDAHLRPHDEEPAVHVADQDVARRQERVSGPHAVEARRVIGGHGVEPGDLFQLAGVRILQVQDPKTVDIVRVEQRVGL